MENSNQNLLTASIWRELGITLDSEPESMSAASSSRRPSPKGSAEVANEHSSGRRSGGASGTNRPTTPGATAPMSRPSSPRPCSLNRTPRTPFAESSHGYIITPARSILEAHSMSNRLKNTEAQVCDVVRTINTEVAAGARFEDLLNRTFSGQVDTLRDRIEEDIRKCTSIFALVSSLRSWRLLGPGRTLKSDVRSVARGLIRDEYPHLDEVDAIFSMYGGTEGAYVYDILRTTADLMAEADEGRQPLSVMILTLSKLIDDVGTPGIIIGAVMVSCIAVRMGLRKFLLMGTVIGALIGSACIIKRIFEDVSEAIEHHIDNEPLAESHDDVREVRPGLPPEIAIELDNVEPYETNPEASYVPVALTGIMMFVLGKRVPAFMKVVHLKKFNEGIHELWSGTESAIDKLVNVVARAFGKKSVTLFKKQQDSVTMWLDRTSKYTTMVRLKADTPTAEMYEEFQMLQQTGIEHQSAWPHGTPERVNVEKGLALLVKLAADYPGNFTPGKVRAEPVGLMLSGEAGVGKTTAMKAIAQYVIKMERPDEPMGEMAKHIYQKGPSPYWEGYSAQTILAMDDVFARRPTPGETESESDMIIKAINQWPLPLNMANVNHKGRYYLVSPYVFATTNLEKVDDLQKAITCPEAIVRRFKFWYHVERVEGTVLGPNMDPDAVWRFREINIITDVPSMYPTKPWHKFSDVCRMIVEERRRRIEYDVASSAGISASIDRMVQAHMEAGVRPARLNTQGASTSALKAVTRGLDRIGVKVGKHAVKVSHRFSGTAMRAGAITGGALVATRKCTGGFFKRVSRHVEHMAEDAGRATKHACDGISNITQLSFAKMALLTGAGVIALRAAWGIIKSLLFPSRRRRLRAQAQGDDEVRNKVKAQQFRIYAGKNRPALGVGLAIDDATLLCPAHFHHIALKRREKLTAVARDGREVELCFPTCHEWADVAVYTRSPSGAKMKTGCKDIRKHVASAGTGGHSVMLGWDADYETFAESRCHIVTYPSTQGGLPLERVMFRHSMGTRVGDCGSVLLLDSGSGPRILGFHTSANDTEGAHFANFHRVVRLTPQADEGDAGFMGHTLISREVPMHNSPLSRIVPTPLRGLFGTVNERPAARRPVNGVDPMLKAVMRLKNDWVELPQHASMCADAVIQEIFQDIRGEQIGPVDTWSAISGLEGVAYAKGIPRSTSPGYPLCRDFHDKKTMLGAEGPYVKGPDYDRLAGLIEEIESKYRRGERAAFFRDTLKDEVRSDAKYSSADTRLISACCAAFAVVGRKQTLRFTAAFMKHRHKHGCMVGMNPNGKEARLLFDLLGFNNEFNNVFAGDYKGFDRSQHPKLMQMVWDSLSRRLVEHGCDADMLAGIGRDTIHARHFGGDSAKSDVVYEVDGTLPSGHFMTSIFNSIYNMVVFRIAWVSKYGTAELFNFRKAVALITYGDDYVASTNNKRQDFNLTYMQQFVQTLGMVMTDEGGEPGGPPTKHVTEASFIRRTFRVDKHLRVWMKLDLESILTMFDWKKKKTPMKEHLSNVSTAALIELAAHDEDVFADYHDRIVEACSRHGVDIATEGMRKHAYAYWQSVHRQSTPHWAIEDPEEMEQAVRKELISFEEIAASSQEMTSKLADYSFVNLADW